MFLRPIRGGVFRCALVLIAVSSVCLLGGCAGLLCGTCEGMKCPPSLCLKATEKPVLLDFYTDECPGCKQIAPIIGKMTLDYEGRAHVVKVDAYESSIRSDLHRVRVLPTVVLYHEGKEVARWEGPQPAETYRAALDDVLAKMPPPSADIARRDDKKLKGDPDCPGGVCEFRPGRSDAISLTRIAKP